MQAPEDLPVGWIESDGFEGMGPEETTVSVGDTLDADIIVQIAVQNKCGYWWVHKVSMAAHFTNDFPS